MQIGETIRKYRKEKSMTQEEMAKRLGVTPPAVNKWENGNSFPDIMLLAPIARLLGIYQKNNGKISEFRAAGMAAGAHAGCTPHFKKSEGLGEI